MKLVEFLYFYLMPEAPATSISSKQLGVMTDRLQRSPSKRVGGSHNGRCDDRGTKTTEEKQGLLGKYLSNVEDLVEDLRENAPFGAYLA